VRDKINPRQKTVSSAPVFLLVLALLFCGCCFCQMEPQSLARQTCSFSEIYQQKGWTIPGLRGAAPSGVRRALTVPPVEGGAVSGVFSTPLKAGTTDPDLPVFKCSHQNPGRLTVQNLWVRALEMERIDFQGRVFAYTVDYEVKVKEAGKLISTLDEVSVTFYDVEGKGAFSLMRYKTLDNSRELLIPDWVRR
jgi:hypothetical protein